MRRAAPRARELRAPLAARGARTLVVAPGDVNEAKCLPALLDAAATLPEDVHVAVVGRRMPSLDLDAAIADRGLGDRVTVRYDVPDDDFRAWLVAGDVGVDLRYPHRGEVSGSLAMAMVSGLPTIVSATGTYLDVPERAVVRIAPGPAEPSSSPSGSGSCTRTRPGAPASATRRATTWPRSAPPRRPPTGTRRRSSPRASW